MSLIIRDLSFAYEKKPVLRDVSFEAKNGQLLSILGPNGVGKTTLFKCILGIERKYSGTIEADGKNTARMSPRIRSHLIASIPQAHPVSFRYTALDMVLMGTGHLISPLAVPGPHEHEIAREAMERLNIGHLAEKPFDRMSGGEQQLVYIARALAQQAKILLMDEPTSSLDYGNQLLVLGVVRQLASEGYTVLLSTHNPQHALWYSDEALALCDGRVLALGRPGDVIGEDLIERLYGRKAALVQTAYGPLLVPEEVG
ncbi:MAG: ABC transporter ATP-binding protein [Lachnospiraceae bacterium]|nr:ABC transporter ATP-binding protein [Lachnospiraceae bacterium]